MMYDDEGTKIEVLHCLINEAHCTLGVMLAPDDNNKGQVGRIRDIYLKIGDNVQVEFI